MTKVLAVLLLTACGLRGQYVTVAAQHITDATGTPASGVIHFAPTVPFRAANSGQIISRPVTATVASGAFSVQLADTSSTTPLNAGYNVWVTDFQQLEVLGHANQNMMSGYNNVQVNASWCSGSTCNFDSYAPSATALPLLWSVSMLQASGTRSAATFLRGDGIWAVPPTGTGGGASNWGSIGGTITLQPDLMALLAAKASASSVPTRTSQLTNDSGFLASAPVLSVASRTGAITLTHSDITDWGSSVPSKTSQITNDSAFLTAVPAPSSSTLGGIKTVACGGGAHVNSIDATGTANCTGDTGSGGGLPDPGSNGIIKRTALNVTAPAVAGVDYALPDTAIRTVSANDTATASDSTILCNASSAQVTETLPAAPGTGKRMDIKKIDSSANVCVISGNGAQIDGNVSVSLTRKGMSVTVKFDGSAWWIL